MVVVVVGLFCFGLFWFVVVISANRQEDDLNFPWGKNPIWDNEVYNTIHNKMKYLTEDVGISSDSKRSLLLLFC